MDYQAVKTADSVGSNDSFVSLDFDRDNPFKRDTRCFLCGHEHELGSDSRMQATVRRYGRQVGLGGLFATAALVLFTLFSSSRWTWEPPEPPVDHAAIAAWWEATEAAHIDLPKVINVSTLPLPRPPPPASAGVKFLSWLPHSGFHNQRITFHNAAALALALNRTLLIPPIWVGASQPTGGSYAHLTTPWRKVSTMVEPNYEDASPLFLRDPSKAFPYVPKPNDSPTPDVSEVGAHRLTPRTFFAWDWLFALEPQEAPFVERGIGKFGNRWFGDGEGLGGMSEQGVRYEVDADGWMDDVRFLKDKDRYDFQYVDTLPQDAPLVNDVPEELRGQFARQINVAAMAQIPQRLLCLGSLFGSARLDVTPIRPYRKDYFEKHLVITRPELVRVGRQARAVIDGFGRLLRSQGTLRRYVAGHARLMDGAFVTAAEKHMDDLFRNLVGRVFWELAGENGLDSPTEEDVQPMVEELRELGRARKDDLLAQANITAVRRDVQFDERAAAWAAWDDQVDLPLDDGGDDAAVPHADRLSRLHRRSRTRSHSRTPRRARQAAIAQRGPPVNDGAALAVASRLTCHSPLHTAPHLRRFNTPLYLATDTSEPEKHPALSLIYSTFPCIVTYSDLSHLDEESSGWIGINAVERWVSEGDGVPIGSHLIPILEAVIAARGSQVAGTSGSTMSRYMTRVLLQANRAEDEAEAATPAS